MSSIFNDPEMQEIFEGFVAETNELLEGLSQDLMILENSPDDMELLNRIFRGFHTIKGTAAFMGFDTITGITHQAEDILNKMRRSELRVNQNIIDVLLEVQDWIQLLVERIQDGNTDPVDYSATIEAIVKIREGSDNEPDNNNSKETESVEKTTANDSNNEGISENKSALQDVLDKSSEIVAKEGDFDEDDLKLIQSAFDEVNKNFNTDNPKPETESESETQKDEPNQTVEKTSKPKTPKTTSDTLKKDTTTPNKPAPQAPKPETINAKQPKKANESIRIDIDRVESLMDLSGELVLGRNRLQQITDNLLNDNEKKELVKDLVESTAQIDFVTSEIQSAVMRMRMVPVGKLYQKAPRIVRDLTREFKKDIKLVVEGEETEIDRGIIEELNDPLVHMIRNSCDHGIESPEERAKAGKPKQGTIKLDADQEGNNIILKISDDGKGMDAQKLKDKAIEKNIITPEQANNMSDREAFQLVFAAGFSTAAVVSAVSGRGVGMDVVRTNIQKLKGMIEIESELGKGTTFIIKLPLTLAIIQGLLVKVDDETFAIPLSSVIEVVAIDKKSVKTINNQEVIRIRNEVTPITRLDEALKCRNIKKELDNRYVVNVGIGVHRLGLVVDELLGQQEIVIKSLGEYLGDISGIAGSTILGDGKVIMIIDVARLTHEIYSSGDYMNMSE
jgi:two-component system chemotaxis sensor kinase CheA